MSVIEAVAWHLYDRLQQLGLEPSWDLGIGGTVRSLRFSVRLPLPDPWQDRLRDSLNAHCFLVIRPDVVLLHAGSITLCHCQLSDPDSLQQLERLLGRLRPAAKY